jgi:hypothetical protein
LEVYKTAFFTGARPVAINNYKRRIYGEEQAVFKLHVA